MNLSRMLKQDVTYWAPSGQSLEGGVTYEASVVLKARWENRAQEFSSQSGETAVSRALIYLQVPVAIGGYVYEGESEEADPRNLDDAQEIRQIASIPDLRNVQQLTVAMI